jgi:hypothetical protein
MLPHPLRGLDTNNRSKAMRYAIFGALILGVELLGVSIPTAAMPLSGNAAVKTNSSGDVIQVYGGCGQWMKYNPRTKKCESF